MKKALTVATVLIALAASPKAEAHPLMCATSAAPLTMSFVGGMAAFALLPVAIVELQDAHVWNDVFTSVDESYPADKHFPHPVKAASNGFGKPYHVTVNGSDTLRSDGF
jgi:hypothetical protein